MGMNFLKWEMTKDEPYPTVKTMEKKLYGRSRLLAVGAFEVTILNDRDRSVRRTDRMISRVRRNCQLE